MKSTMSPSAEPVTTHSVSPRSGSLLTDELLARFAKRAAAYDRENRSSPTTSRSSRSAATCASPFRPSLAGPALACRRSCGNSAAWRYHAAPTALAINMHLYWTGVAADLWRAGDTSLHVAPRGDGARRGVRRRSRRKRQRHPGAALDHEGRTRRRRLPLHRPQVVREPVAGVDLSRPPRVGHRRPVAAEDGPRVHAARHGGLPHRRDVGHARHARDAQRRHDARRRLRARSLHRPGRAGRGGRHRPFRPRRLRLGAARFRQHLLRAGAARARSDHRGGQVEALDRALPADGLPRRAAASRRRDGARASRRSARTSSASPTTGRTASITARPGRPRSSRPSTTRSKARGESSIWRSRWPAASASSAAASSNGSSAMRVSAASTPPTRC